MVFTLFLCITEITLFSASAQIVETPEVLSEYDVDIVYAVKNPLKNSNENGFLPWRWQADTAMSGNGRLLYSRGKVMNNPGFPFLENGSATDILDDREIVKEPTTIEPFPTDLSRLTDKELQSLYHSYFDAYESSGLISSELKGYKEAQFYFASLAIVSKFSFESGLKGNDLDSEINSFLNRVGKSLSFDEKIEFASTLSSMLVFKYDDERAKFNTSGTRGLSEMLSRMADPSKSVGVCGDIMLATNAFLVALDPSLKQNVFGLSYSIEQQQHLVTAVFNPNAKDKEIRIIDYDTISSYKKGDPFLLDTMNSAEYKSYGIQARLYNVEGRELSEIQSDRFQFFSKLLGAKSNEQLSFSSSALESPGMSSIKVRIVWKQKSRSDLIKKSTTVLAGVGSLSQRSYEGIALQLNKNKMTLKGGEKNRTVQLGIISSQDQLQFPMNTNIIFILNKNWKSRDLLKSENVSLKQSIGMSIGASMDLSKGYESKIGMGGDGWGRGYLKTELKIKTSEKSTLSLDHAQFNGVGLSKIDQLYSIKKDFKSTLKSVILVNNGMETNLTFEKKINLEESLKLKLTHFSSPYGGVARVSAELRNKKNAFTVQLQTPSTIQQNTPISLLQEGLNDNRISLQAEKTILRPKKIWKLKAGVNAPLDGASSMTLISAGVKLQSR